MIHGGGRGQPNCQVTFFEHFKAIFWHKSRVLVKMSHHTKMTVVSSLHHTSHEVARGGGYGTNHFMSNGAGGRGLRNEPNKCHVLF